MTITPTWGAPSDGRGHVSPVTCVDAAPGGRGPLVSGGYDGQVVCWDEAVTAPRWARRFADLVNAVKVDRGGRRVAIAVADGYAYVADLRDGRLLQRLGPHGDDVNDVSWHPHDGDTLATVCDAWDVGVHLWDVASGTRSGTLYGHEHGVFAAEFSPAADVLATASEDGTVRIWSPVVATPLAVLAHPGDVETLAWSPTGRLLATGCDDGRLRVWAAGDWSLQHEIADGEASVRKVGFSPSGSSLLGASYDATVRVYDVPSLRLRRSCRAPLQWERACALVDDDTLVVGSFGARPLPRSLAGHRRGVTDAVPRTWGVNAVAVGRDGAVYAGTDCGVVTRLGDSEALHESTTLISCVRPSPDGRTVAIVDYLGRMFLAGEWPSKLVAETAGGPLNTVEWLPDGTLATGGYDGCLRRWTASGEPLQVVRAHHGPVKAVTWCPAAEVLVAGSSDDTLSAWRGGDRLEEVSRYSDDTLTLVNALAAPAAEPWVAVVSRDRHARIWHVTGDRPPTALPAIHDKSVKAVTVSPDGRLMVTGSYDGSVAFWHLDGDQRVCGWRRAVLHGKPGVSSVAAGANAVFTAGWDGSLGEWSYGGDLVRHHVVRP